MSARIIQFPRGAERADASACDHHIFCVPEDPDEDICCEVPGGCGEALDERSVLLAVLQELDLARSPRAAPDPTVGDLAALVRRLARALRKPSGNKILARQALDYLQRRDLSGSPLREPRGDG